ITGMDTAAMISRIFLGDAIRATPPSARICAGTRSSAITDTAPAFSAMMACSALVTSMMTPPLSISARPVLRRREVLVLLPLFWDMLRTLWIPFRDREESAVSLQLSALSYPLFDDGSRVLPLIHSTAGAGFAEPIISGAPMRGQSPCTPGRFRYRNTSDTSAPPD